MALLFRKKQVISNIRAAYLLKYHDNGLVVDDNEDGIEPYEPDVDLSNLNARLRRDISADNLTSMLSQSPNSPTTPISVGSLGPPTGLAPHQEGLGGPIELPHLNHQDDSMDVDLKNYGMDIDEDSDFEEDLLNVAQEIKLSSQPGKRRSTSDSEARRSVHTSPSKHYTATSVNMFERRDFAEHTGGEPSRLTSQLTATTHDPKEQYLEAVAGLGNNGSAGVTLLMHLPGKQRLSIVVKQDCTGHLALGYALLKSGQAPADANMYNLHLAEDDGEPDEDFPALDRSRPVASYHVDELAVVRATESEFRINSTRTPNKISFKTKSGPAVANREHAPTPSLAAIQPFASRSTAGSFAGSLSGARADIVALRIFMYPYDPLLSDVFWEDSMTARNSKLSVVFEQMCREKMMDTEMFVLRTVDEQPNIISLTASVDSLFPEAAASSSQDFSSTLTLEVVPRRNLPGSANGRQTSVPPPVHGPTPFSTELNGANPSQQKRRSGVHSGPVLPMQPLGFYKYPVLRRQQMNFLGRGEREFVIDGEYVHIMPPTDWSLLDQPKTTTFHIRQVIRVKQRKVPTNFYVTVMKASGPKRYDMESKDASTTAEIVHRIQSLKNARSSTR